VGDRGVPSPGRSLLLPGQRLVPAEVDPDFVAVDAAYCQYLKQDTEQCRAWPKADEIYCGIHLRSMRALDALNAAVADTEGE
jgi:hypothetical protein